MYVIVALKIYIAIPHISLILDRMWRVLTHTPWIAHIQVSNVSGFRILHLIAHK